MNMFAMQPNQTTPKYQLQKQIINWEPAVRLHVAGRSLPLLVISYSCQLNVLVVTVSHITPSTPMTSFCLLYKDDGKFRMAEVMERGIPRLVLSYPAFNSQRKVSFCACARAEVSPLASLRSP